MPAEPPVRKTLYPNGVAVLVDGTWPLTIRDRELLFMAHQPEASRSPDGFRLATCVLCSRPMVAMWHLWIDREIVTFPDYIKTVVVKELHMCHKCATDEFGAPTPDNPPFAARRVSIEEARESADTPDYSRWDFPDA